MEDTTIQELQAEIQILKGIIARLLPIVNRMLLNDDDENCISVAAMVVDYPIHKGE
jgi:hypothetical protein